MADLGNIGRSVSASVPAHVLGFSGAVGALFSVALSMPVSGYGRGSLSTPGGLVVDLEDADIGDRVALLESGQLVDVHRVQDGHAYFYDLADGEYHAASSTSAKAWSVVVSERVATVTPLAGSGGGGDYVPQGSMTFT